MQVDEESSDESSEEEVRFPTLFLTFLVLISR